MLETNKPFSSCRHNRRSASLSVGLAVALTLGATFPDSARGQSSASLSRVDETLDELLTRELDRRASYQIVRLSETLFHVQFSTTEERLALLEGIRPERLATLNSSLAAVIPDSLVAEAFAELGPDAGAVAQFRDDLTAAGLVLPLEADHPKALLTTVEVFDSRDLYDFSLSGSQEEITTRKENLRRQVGATTGETGALLQRPRPAGYPGTGVCQTGRGGGRRRGP